MKAAQQYRNEYEKLVEEHETACKNKKLQVKFHLLKAFGLNYMIYVKSQQAHMKNQEENQSKLQKALRNTKNATIELLRDKNLPLLELEDILSVAMEIEDKKCENQIMASTQQKKLKAKITTNRKQMKRLQTFCKARLNKFYDKLFLTRSYDELQIKASFYHLNIAQNSCFNDHRKAYLADLRSRANNTTEKLTLDSCE